MNITCWNIPIGLDAMDGELRGAPLFKDVEEMGQVEREARRHADDLINRQQ